MYIFTSFPGRSGASWSAPREDRAAVGDPGGAVPAHAPVQRAGERLQGQAASRGHEAKGPPGQLTQVHGHVSQTTHILLSLRGFHLVRKKENTKPTILGVYLPFGNHETTYFAYSAWLVTFDR